MDKSEEKKNIYTKLRELRRTRGLTVDTLAKKIGENSQKVSRIERGRRSLTIDYLVKISKAFGTPIGALINTNDSSKENSEDRASSRTTSNILNEVVIFIEKYCEQASGQWNAQQKANMISKIYEMVLKFPADSQSLFLTSLFESIKTLQSK